MPHEGWLPACIVCKQSADLCQSKTDEFGRAVHEDCYASTLVSRKARRHKIRSRAARENFGSIKLRNKSDCEVRNESHDRNQNT